MGQYFWVIDIDSRKRLTFLGKFVESFWDPGLETMRQLWYGVGPNAGHRILVIGDYTESIPPNALTEQEKTEFRLDESYDRTLYRVASEWEEESAVPGEPPISPYAYCLLRNLDRKEYVDLGHTPEILRSALMYLVVWTDDPLLSPDDQSFGQGEWAGDHVDLAPRGTFDQGWTNVTYRLIPKLYSASLENSSLPWKRSPAPEFSEDDDQEDREITDGHVNIGHYGHDKGEGSIARQWRALPVDVYRLFIGLLQRKDIGSVYSTSRELQHAATPFVFATFTIDTAQNVEERCDALRRGGRVEYVRSCRLLLNSPLDECGLAILRDMVNLDRLSILQTPARNCDFVNQTLQHFCSDAVPWQLKSFVANVSTIPEDFVAQQQALERLVLPGVDCNFASPGHPIQYIRGEQVKASASSTLDVLRFAFPNSFENISHLCISGSILTRLSKFSVDFSRIRTIEVIFGACDLQFRRETLDWLSLFSNVERALITDDYGSFGFFATGDYYSWTQFLSRLDTPTQFVHPTLKTIMFRTWHGWKEVMWDSKTQKWQVVRGWTERSAKHHEPCPWVPYIPDRYKSK